MRTLESPPGGVLRELRVLGRGVRGGAEPGGGGGAARDRRTLRSTGIITMSGKEKQNAHKTF